MQTQAGHFDVPDEVTFTTHYVVEREVRVRVFEGKAEVFIGEPTDSDYDPFGDGNVWDGEDWINMNEVAEALTERGMTWKAALDAAYRVVGAE